MEPSRRWDEPFVIAGRLAQRLGVSARRWPDSSTGDEALVVPASMLDDVDDRRLGATAAIVVAGDPADATSAGLVALRERVAARAALTPVLSVFATSDDGDGDAAEVPVVVATGAADAERIGALLAAGPHALTLDAAVDVDAVGEDDRPARVCVVSFELAGMTGGGIGTASTALAETLARAGHDVTFLFSGWQDAAAGEANERWRRHCEQHGVRLRFLRSPGNVTPGTPHLPVSAAYELDRWLRRQPTFDVVHVPENMGQGAYALLAKAHGVAHAGTTFVVGTHGPTRWAAEANRLALTHEEFLAKEALERISVERADVLLGPSRYLHDYMRQRDWRLPARVHVQPYATPAAVRGEAFAVPPSVRARSTVAVDVGRPAEAARPGDGLPRELVFFGRLETRKGVATLCDALDLLAADDAPPQLAVTFLGPIAEVLGQPADAYIAQRAARWPWHWEIVSDLDQRGAAERLARPGVLALMPSTVDNAPNTVSEAVALAIPFVAGRSGGTGELVAAEQRDEQMFGDPAAALLPRPLPEAVADADARPLAALLRRRLAEPVTPARAPYEPAAVDAAYDRWHRAVARAADTAADAADADRPQQQRPLPSLAICLLHDGDQRLLAAQLDALAASRVIVADLRPDGSGPIAALRGREVEVVRPRRAGHGGDARNAALAAAGDAELIAVVPPADLPLDGFAAGLRGAAAATGADVYACVVLDETDDAADETDGDPALRAFLPLPPAALAGLSHHAFAAGPYAISRAALDRIGGFAADARADEADHELLNRAAVAGLRLEPIAEPLAAKRRHDRWSRVRSVLEAGAAEPPYDAAQWLCVERPYAAAGLVGLLRGQRDDSARLRRDVAEAHRAYERRLVDQRAWIDDLEGKAQHWRSDIATLLADNDALRGANESLRAANEELSRGAMQIALGRLRAIKRRLTAASGR